MKYKKAFIKEAMDYTIQQIEANQAMIKYFMHDDALMSKNKKGIEECLKVNQTYTNILKILMNTETID